MQELLPEDAHVAAALIMQTNQLEIQMVDHENSMTYYRMNCSCGRSSRAWGHSLKRWAIDRIYKYHCECGKINLIHVDQIH